MGQNAGVLQGCETCMVVQQESRIHHSDMVKAPPFASKAVDLSGVGVWDDLLNVCEDVQPAIPKEKKGSMKPLLKGKERRDRPDADVEALLGAAQFGALERVRALLQGDVDVNGCDQSGWTALHWAAQEGHLEVCQALLRAGADPTSATKEGLTPLQAAEREDADFASRFRALVVARGGM